MIKVTEMTEFASRRAAGLFESVRGLSSALQREGLAEVRIVTQRDAFSDLDRPGWGNVDLEYVVPGGRLRWLTGGDMADAFLRAPADVVHVHSLWTCAERGMVNRVRRGVRTPYVFAPRGSMSPWAMNYKRWKKRLSWPVWEAALLSHASCLHALNAAEADMIRRIEKRVPICVVSNGIDLPQMIDIEKGNRRKLLYLGRLHPIKGLT
ncbi:MAG: glycosyltransferase [Rhizobiales bacterium]|nr:glycosyltransferase [Hyphomicrobiales bacterium]